MLVWLAPIVVFGLVVFVHELGHFIAAKLAGVYAPRFSIGFGPALWRRRRGETEYVLAALPLGGYVRMASREDDATAFIEGGAEELRSPDDGRRRRPDWDPNALVPFGPRPVPAERWFESKPLLARIFILIAGVTMNAVLAVVVSIGVVAGYGKPYHPAIIDSVVAGQPAAVGGLHAGDRIVAIGGRPVKDWADVVDVIGASAGRLLTVEVVRGGQRVALAIRPGAQAVTDPVTGHKAVLGRMGAAVRDTILRERVGPREAVGEGIRETWWLGTRVVGIVRGLFVGEVPLSQLGGPIAIAKTSVEAARSGLEDLLRLLAFLSINVAILNLLPVPILDGGQILLNVAEAAKGSAFSARTREYILRAGFGVLVLLILLVFFNDLGLARLFH